jgi:DNA polymerase-3 subunit alpha
MQIAQVLGGYSLGGADLLRRAMGKKKAEEMAKQRALFLEGSGKKGVDPKIANGVFDLMEKFAQYGFNKSHSAAYGLITIHTAWLKAHHPVEFMAALLTSEKDNTDKVVLHIAEARQAGYQVLPPDINESDLAFGAVDGKIRFGLGAIKGVGESAIEAIVEARREKRFTSLFDFCERVDGRRVNRKTLEALVQAGAFDFEKRHRRQLFETVGMALERGASTQRDLEVGQSNLFGMLAASTPPGKGGARDDYAPVEPWTEKEKLSFEKAAIGFYVSGHPLDAYQKELRRYARPIQSVQRARRDEKLTVAGIVSAMRERPTKTGKRMAWVTLEDLSGSVELVVFPGREGGGSRMDPKTGKWMKSGPRPGYEQWESLLKSDDALLVTGTVQMSRDEENPQAELIVEDIQSLREVREKRVKRLELRLHVDMATDEKLARLAELAKKHAGATPVAVALHMPGEAEALVGSTNFKVQVSDELLESVNRLFGARVAEPG